MDLIQHYKKLYKEASEKILTDNYTIDKQIDSGSDNRFGITLLIRPDLEIKNNIQNFLNELKEIEPKQYYYPNSDIHLTVLSIISCYDNFDLATISVPDYTEIIQKSLASINQFEINFRGVTASDSAIMIQGFPSDNSLNALRDNLRDNFKNSGLEESIDRRYSIATTHLTVVRFREKIENKEKLIQITDRFQNHDFGKLIVKNMEFVYNDWYQREKKVKKLYRFELEK